MHGSSRSSPPLAVAIVDGDSLSRHAISMRLAAEDDIELVGEATDASTGISLVRERRVDVVMLELAPDRSELDAMREIREISAAARVIMLGAGADEGTQLQALQAGAVGFLLKPIDLDVIPRVLRGVQAGEAAVSRALTSRLLEEVRAREAWDHS